MPKFIFRLESMKKYRANRLLLAKKEMLKIEADLYQKKTQLNQAVIGRGEEIEASLKNLGVFAAARLHSELGNMQAELIGRIQEDIKGLESEFERNREWVVQLGQELKIVEKLEEKQRSVHDSEQRMDEKRKMDRWVAERRRGEDS